MAQHPAHARDHRHQDKPSPVQVRKSLDGAHYPATRVKLVETARRNAADGEIVAALKELPDRHYDSLAAFSKHLARQL